MNHSSKKLLSLLNLFPFGVDQRFRLDNDPEFRVT